MKAKGLDEKSKEVVIVLSTFVRFAEKLDRSHCGLVKKAMFIREDKDNVLLEFYSDSDCSFEEWSIIQNRQAFFEAFDKHLEVHCVVTPNTA